jgi:hypothetical protein
MAATGDSGFDLAEDKKNGILLLFRTPVPCGAMV